MPADRRTYWWMDGRITGRTNGLADERTDGRTAGRTTLIDARSGHSPSYTTEIMTSTATKANRSRLRCAAGINYELSVIRQKIAERAFSYAGPASWNSLPNELWSIAQTFKFALKTHLLKLAYNTELCNPSLVTRKRRLVNCCSGVNGATEIHWHNINKTNSKAGAVQVEANLQEELSIPFAL